MADRMCGTCTACCNTHAVDTLLKPMHTWCAYCAVGEGCKIYERRPSECATFKCLWLSGVTGEDEERPDKSQIVMSYFTHPDLRTSVLEVVEMSVGASFQPAIRQFVQEQLRLGVCVLIKRADEESPILILGRGIQIPAAAFPSLWREKVEILREKEYI